MKDIKIGIKLLVCFLILGTLPLLFVGYQSVTNSKAALETQAFQKLESVREIKKFQIERYFKEREGDMKVLVNTVSNLKTSAFKLLKSDQSNKEAELEKYFAKLEKDLETISNQVYVRKLYSELVVYHNETFVTETGNYDVTTDKYRLLYDEFAPEINKFQKTYGLYDIFLICAAHGHIMYSAEKESDLGQNLGYGPLKAEGIAQVWKEVKSTGKIAYADFSPYSPSNGAQALFAGAPVKDDSGQLIGVLVFQVPTKPIHDIVHRREGMGETGETFLVSPRDGKVLLRSDMITKGNGSLKIGKEYPEPYANKLVAKNGGTQVYLDAKGHPYIAHHKPLKIRGLDWYIVSIKNIEEAIATKLENESKDYFTKYIEEYGYYDLFLIAPNGYVFYTSFKEPDYQTNMISGKYSSSNLGELTREVLKTNAYGITDFKPYAPSNGAPAAFIAQPLITNGKVDLVVALQLPLDTVNAIMQERTGMGKTGESYLIGSDKLMRSDSFLDPDNHTVKASFANPSKGSVDTEASKEAIAGKTDAKIVIDYNGNPVLSAFTPVKIGNFQWGLLAEIDEAEAFAVVKELRSSIIKIAVISVILILIIAIFMAKAITDPILKTVNMVQELSKGNLDIRLNLDQKDEIGDMAKALDSFADNMKDEVLAAFKSLADGNLTFVAHGVIREPLAAANESLNQTMLQIQQASHEVDSGSAQISDASQSLSQGATESAASLEEISSSMTEIGSQTKANAENATQANLLASETRASAETGNGKMMEMMSAMEAIQDSSSQIAKIIKVIDDIAFQTNLLALNAAVEAARAGRHGKGFAVVADEVRNLAGRSAKAAKETSEMIESSIAKVSAGTEIATATEKSLQEIVASSVKVADLIGEIAAASNEQAQGIAQIGQGLEQIDKVTQQNTANAEETAAAAEELSGQARELNALISKFKLAEASGMNRSYAQLPNNNTSIDRRGTMNRAPKQIGGQHKMLKPSDQIALDDDEFGRF